MLLLVGSYSTMWSAPCLKLELVLLDCITIQQWLHKCKDDSETANYIRANTKDVR